MDAAPKASQPKGAIEHFSMALGHAHRELLGLGSEVRSRLESGASDSEIAAAITQFTTTLLNHHRSEDVFFFPAFRAAGRLSAIDVPFLEDRDGEHVPIHRLALELQAAGTDLTAGRAVERPQLLSKVDELHERSVSHFAAEEATLTAEHVATFLTDAEMVAIQRDMGQNWNRA
jgi:hemerythrin